MRRLDIKLRSSRGRSFSWIRAREGRPSFSKLLDTLCEEEDAQKKFERAQEEKQKWLKKIEMHEQAARILEEVNDS